MGNCHHRKAYSSQDIIIKCPVEEIARQFFDDYIVVWHAVNVDSAENQQIRHQLERFCEVKTFTEWERASAFILRTKKKCYVITSGENGESLVKEICSKENVLGIYIYCKNKDFHFAWAQKYPKTADLEKNAAAVVIQVKEKLFKWYQTQDFEKRFPVFLPASSAEMTPLKIAVHFKNRVEAKNDLLTLARMIYSDDQSAALIDSFEEDEENPKDILANWWPDKKSFLYRITQSCLRVGSLDALDYCRLVLKDMEKAFKEEKNEEFKDGLVLYKGIEVAEEEEWLRWKENLDGEIEVQGFLSASKEKNVALEFIKKEESKRVLITIIMPKGPNGVEDEQGFVLKEEEVLFNTRSRFTVLEIEDLPGRRHIVLLYGAQGFRSYMTEKNPVQEISIPKGKISCLMCHDEICGAKMFYLSLANLKNCQYSCQKCLKKFLKKEGRNGPLLCIPAEAMTKNGYITKLKGFMMAYPQELKILFSGYKCCKCQVKKPEKSYYYKCVECCKVWCGDCVEGLSECIQTKHNLILESAPFSFWCEKTTSQDETFKEKDLFQQAENYYNRSQNEKAMEYYKLYLRQNNEKKTIDKNLATSCHNIGIIYDNRKEYQRALEYFFKALEIRKSVYGEYHTDIANTFNRIGLVYWRQEENEKALEFFSRALEIWKAIHGEKHVDITNAYNNIGLVHDGQEEYNKALESYFKAVEIRKALSGESSLNLAINCHNIARTFQKQEEYMNAEEYHLKALEIRKSLYGENHSDVADSYHDIGDIYCEQKEYSKALESSFKALEIRKLIHGENHADVAVSYNEIGQIYSSQNQSNKALEYYSQAIQVAIKASGEKNAYVATYHNNIGHVYSCQGKYIDALESYEKALNIRKSIYGEVHWSVASSYHSLGTVHSGKKALEYHLKALEINEEIYGENDSCVASSCDYVGLVFCNQGNYEKSIEYYLKALEIRETIYGENHCKTASSYQNIGTVYFNEGEIQEGFGVLLSSSENQKVSLWR